MGEVRVGHAIKLDPEVAVTFVRFQDGISDDEIRRHFNRESRIAARLQHPGCLPCTTSAPLMAAPYLVMQWGQGTSISDLIAQHERLGDRLGRRHHGPNLRGAGRRGAFGNDHVRQR